MAQVTINRIFLECTNTWESDVNTGIQRVVRNIVLNSADIQESLDFKVIPVVVSSNSFWLAGEKQNNSILNGNFWSYLKKLYSNIRPLLNILPGDERTEYYIILYARRVLRSLVGIFASLLKKNVAPLEELCPGKGDILLLLDSSWMYPIWPAVKKTKDNGALVALIVYDIIPLTHPEFFPYAIRKRFKEWFAQAVQEVDFFICISRTVQNELEKYLMSNSRFCRKTSEHTASFHLGCILDNVASEHPAGDGSEPQSIREKKGFYITVGTIESRKNHKYLLDAFDIVWCECPSANLCIIGKIGWLSDDVIKRIKKHPQFNKKLFMLDNASDNDLEYLYKNSKALLYASFVEGFGLPIVEALHYGLPVFASDIPTHREIGRDFCTYFDIGDPACLAKIITEIEKTGKIPVPSNAKQYVSVTWKDSCRELFSVIKTLAVKTPV